MAYQTIEFSRQGRVATISLDRPESLNAFVPELLQETGQALETVAADEGISVLVLTGKGRAFSAGVDLKALKARGLDLSSGDVGPGLNDNARRVTELLESMPQATIAKVNGHCFTGGLEIMLACDIILVAEEAKLGDTHAVLGLRPTWGMTQRLPRRVGLMRARELSFTARTISGREAAEMGLALEALPAAELDARVDELAAAIAANSPGSIAAYKDLYRQAANLGLEAGLDYERKADYVVADVEERFGAFLAKLGGKGK
ncbi:MAG TPA: enoyl-CoA hydratase/isomerase family protein [Alphaproteobacteria bacterium]|jgi:enoyl-CoA hydratase/carnithine racemase|nr:enoyl-CoA hydratase/isomerase family protein [Alphaproteobacteria bacterium]MDP7426642.1 enoyl-CoA hydratase/isomerase family protein [Alphaproteobacteria bacterium]HJM51455.1 enoyl-CoA hydratase/isomerase family protein [Alphaproteobacteria bacterium]